MRSFLMLLFVVVALFSSLSLHSHAAKEINEDELRDNLKLSPWVWGRRGFSSYRIKPYYQAAAMTCDKNIRVCRAKGSRGRSCCKKKCVDLKEDRYNCGRCGKKCKYSEICCKGKCVNPMLNRNHCGGCNNKCNRGSLCIYGMCGYA